MNRKMMASKVFAKLTKKDLLWAFFGKYREYERFLLTVVHNLSKNVMFI